MEYCRAVVSFASFRRVSGMRYLSKRRDHCVEVSMLPLRVQS
jgi:predicted DNA-binding ribbon-helix-helix protein